MPGNRCVMNSCKAQSFKPKHRHLTFYTFPWSNEHLLKAWLSFVDKTGTDRGKILKSSRICSQHFDEQDDRKNDQIPTKFEPGK